MRENPRRLTATHVLDTLMAIAKRRGAGRAILSDPIADRREVTTVVCRECPEELLALWPARRPQGTMGGFRLFSSR